MSGKLYVVATPIGNLGDISGRAVEVLSSVDYIISEDTRVTKKLVNHINQNSNEILRLSSIAQDDKAGLQTVPALSNTKMVSYHHHSGEAKKLWILNQLNEGKDIALVADAGTPGIQDPGNELIAFLLENNPDLKVIPIPGPSSLTAALSVCGFNINRFTFLGFLKKKGLKKLFDTQVNSMYPFAFFESPYRIIKTLKILQEVAGSETQVFVGRELTKMHETIYRGGVEEVIKNLENDTLKGEIVVVVNQ